MPILCIASSHACHSVVCFQAQPFQTTCAILSSKCLSPKQNDPLMDSGNSLSRSLWNSSTNTCCDSHQQTVLLPGEAGLQEAVHTQMHGSQPELMSRLILTYPDQFGISQPIYEVQSYFVSRKLALQDSFTFNCATRSSPCQQSSELAGCENG